MAEPSFDALYLSPHLDDAALSCGGQIHDRVARGERVLIATVLTADIADDLVLSDFARATLAAWGLERADAMARRRAEDRAAGDVLGAEILHLGLTDAMFRVDDTAPRYTAWKAILHGQPTGEAAVLTAIEEALRKLPRAAFVAAPLAAGHVDHRLVRAAAESVYGSPLVLYEDQPYARHLLPRWRARARSSTRATVAVTGAGRAAKRRAIACYVSQDGLAMASGADRELVRRRGERIWRRPTD